MASKIVLLDTSIPIDYFRKKDKSKTSFVRLADSYSHFYISAITEYEIRSGINIEQETFWQELLGQLEVLLFESQAVLAATKINNELKRKRKQIAIPDLFIAATAIANKLPLATLNRKHFERIDNLVIVE
jgi:tRNA(fMet)-specific endonuclease VapC